MIDLLAIQNTFLQCNLHSKVIRGPFIVRGPGQHCLSNFFHPKKGLKQAKLMCTYVIVIGVIMGGGSRGRRGECLFLH